MWQAAAHRLVRRSNGWRSAAGAAGIVLAVAGCTGAAAAPSLGGPTASGPAVSELASPGAGSPSEATVGMLEATIDLPSPRDVTAAFGSIWVANGPAATVTRLDPATAAVQAVVSVPDPASVLSGGDGAMFVTSYPGNSLTRIDPATNQATKTISLASAGSGPIGVVAADGDVWVGEHDGTPVTSIAKVDPNTMKIVDVIPVGDESEAGPQWVASGGGSIWTDVASINSVVRIDPKTDAVLATIPVPGGCGAQMVATDDAVWVANGGGDGCTSGVYRIDPRTNAVAQTIPMAEETDAIALGADGLWFGSAPTTLGRIDPATGTETGRMTVPGMAFGAAIGGGAVWITDRDDEQLFKIGPS